MSSRIFYLDQDYSVVAEFVKTRRAFKHTAVLFHRNRELDRCKICYQNRTWESYTFQSVVHKMIGKHFNESLHKHFFSVVDAQGKAAEAKPFGLVKGIIMAGSMFCETKAETNALKKKMLSSISGIDFPDDFDQLDEDEKERRLDGAIAQL